MNSLEDKIESLELSKTINKKLHSADINIINDIWIINRKKLKEIGLTDKEIKSVIISMQLQGLDLNKKIYD